MAFNGLMSALKLVPCAILVVGWLTLSQSTAEDTEIEPVIVTFEKWQDFSVRPESFVKVQEDETCESGPFKGNRYMSPDDPSVVLIYDSCNNFVGSQVGISEDEVNTNVRDFRADWGEWFDNNPQMIKEKIGDKTYFMMTIYKQEPDSVCGCTDPKANGFLYVIHHEGDKQYLKVNRNDIDGLLSEGWVQNTCFDKMGDHYRYHVGKEDWDCLKYFTPIFFYSVKGRIIGHGWNFPSVYASPNFEPFPYDYVAKVFDPSPNCILDVYNTTKGFSAEHMYYVPAAFAQAIVCPK